MELLLRDILISNTCTSHNSSCRPLGEPELDFQVTLTLFHPLIKAKSQRWNSAMGSINLHLQKHAKILTCKSEAGGGQNYLNYSRVAIKSRIDIPCWTFACRIKKHFFSSNAEKICMLTYFSRKHDWSSSQNGLRISALLFHLRNQNMYLCY